jgi:4-alpha-glucanotransferase
MRFPRSSVILLHPAFLPGQFGSGNIGAQSFHFVDWLVKACKSFRQMLLLNPKALANSPNTSYSTFAGSLLLDNLQKLVSREWQTKEDLCIAQGLSMYSVDYSDVIAFRMRMLAKTSKHSFRHEISENSNESMHSMKI